MGRRNKKIIEGELQFILESLKPRPMYRQELKKKMSERRDSLGLKPIDQVTVDNFCNQLVGRREVVVTGDLISLVKSS
jgi:hypothetical protein